MLQRGVRQPSHSRYSGSAPQAHLRELVAQGSHGRPMRSPTNIERRKLSLSILKYGKKYGTLLVFVHAF